MLFVKIFCWEMALSKIQDVWKPSAFCPNSSPSLHTHTLLEGGGVQLSVSFSFLLFPCPSPPTRPSLLSSPLLSFLAAGAESLSLCNTVLILTTP